MEEYLFWKHKFTWVLSIWKFYNSYNDNDNSSVMDSWLYLLLQDHSPPWNNSYYLIYFWESPGKVLHVLTDQSTATTSITSTSTPKPSRCQTWGKRRLSPLCYATPAQGSQKAVLLLFFFFPGVLNAITLSYFYQHPFISIEPEMNSWDWARKKRYIWVATFRLYPESPLSLTANTWL